MRVCNTGEIAFFLLFCILITLGCGNRNTDLKSESAITVTLAEVTVMDVPHTIKQVGTLKANERVMVKSEAKGKVTTIHFEEGAQIKEGELLVKLDDIKIKAEIESIKSRIAQYQAELVNTKRNVLRDMDLLKEGVITQKDYDDIITKRIVGEAILKEAEANLSLAQEQLKDTSIVSPLNGCTSERMVFVGDYIGVGDPIVKVVHSDPLKLSFRIPEKYIPTIKHGTKVRVTVEAYPGKEFSGNVYFVSPDIDTDTRTFLVKAKIPNPSGELNPGMFASVSVTTALHRNALVVSWETLVMKENETYIFRVDEGRAKRVDVNVLSVFDGRAEVEGDLSEGGQVVKEGKYSVKDGDQVSATVN